MKKRLTISILISLIILYLGIRLGSVEISFHDGLSIFLHKVFGMDLPKDVKAIHVSIFWDIRFPRVLVAFFVGGALSVSGAVMQAVLQNPLASSYTLGVSSGASLGAAFIIVSGIQLAVLKALLLPVTAFASGLLTIFLVLLFSSKLDKNMKNQTIILVGMVVSLFVSAVLTVLSSLFTEQFKLIYFFTMGSFSSRKWIHVAVLLPCVTLGSLAIQFFSRELDIMTFGDEEAASIGVNVRKTKKLLIVLAALLTGLAVSFAGVIGFIDLVIPHAVRRVFGPRHRTLLPMSFLYGGAFMTLSDLIARTVLSPREIPVGAVTAIIGAIFFAYIFYRKRKEAM